MSDTERRVELRPLADFTPREHEQLAALGAQIDFEVPAYVWTPGAETPWRVLVWEGDELVGHVGILEREIMVGGAPVVVAGIRSVMTRPDRRGRGHASAALARAHQFIADELPRAQFGLLVCLDKRVPLYSRLGWQLVRARTDFAQPHGEQVNEINTMVRPFRATSWPVGTVDLCGPPW